MKALSSPWVTGGLVVVAVAVVGYQVLSSGRGRGRTSHAQPAAPAPPPPAASAPTPQNSAPARSAPSKQTTPSLSTGIDREYVALHFANWAETGRRDPFLLHRPLNQPKAVTNAPSQVSKWKLRAIWRQTGSRIAAINNAIYKEGDVIEGYKIIRIEDEVVWFQNPDSLDHLEFERRAAAHEQPKGANTISVETKNKN